MDGSKLAVSAALLTAAISFPGFAAQAAEFKVLSSGAVKTALDELVPAFERATEHKVTVTYAGTNAIISRFKADEPLDVVILAAPALDELIKQGKLASRFDLVRSGIGLAVRSGAPKPALGSVDDFKRALLASKTFARSEGPSGVYIAGLIERLGIADDMKAKTTIVRTGLVAELVARGEVEIGVQQISEVLAVAGVDVLPLPSDVQHFTTFALGLSSGAKDADAAKAFVKFLTSAAAAPVIKAKGLEPPS